MSTRIVQREGDLPTPRGRRRIATSAMAIIGVVAVSAGCGTTDRASTATLPPMRTTTSSSAPPTSTIPEGERFYQIQPNDTLAIIAERYGVSIQSIVTLNALADPDAIQAGQTIEIPSGGTPPTTTTP
jgi:LysM repeat protein